MVYSAAFPAVVKYGVVYSRDPHEAKRRFARAGHRRTGVQMTRPPSAGAGRRGREPDVIALRGLSRACGSARLINESRGNEARQWATTPSSTRGLSPRPRAGLRTAAASIAALRARTTAQQLAAVRGLFAHDLRGWRDAAASPAACLHISLDRPRCVSLFGASARRQSPSWKRDKKEAFSLKRATKPSRRLLTPRPPLYLPACLSWSCHSTPPLSPLRLGPARSLFLRTDRRPRRDSGAASPLCFNGYGVLLPTRGIFPAVVGALLTEEEGNAPRGLTEVVLSHTKAVTRRVRFERKKRTAFTIGHTIGEMVRYSSIFRWGAFSRPSVALIYPGGEFVLDGWNPESASLTFSEVYPEWRLFHPPCNVPRRAPS